MLNGNFKDRIYELLDYPERFSKDEIYNAFLDMSERYLNEMVNTINLERALTEGMDKEAASDLIEQVALSDPEINHLDDMLFSENDPKERIRILIDYTANPSGRSGVG